MAIQRRLIISATLSGLLLTAAFPKVGWALLAWIGLVPILVALQRSELGSGFRLGYLAGLVHFLSLTYWIAHAIATYGGLPWLLAIPILFLLTAYLALFPALFLWILKLSSPGPILSMVLAPSLWVGLEYLRGVFLTGFPWELLGYSQYRFLSLIQSADILGVYGISFLLVAANTALALSLCALAKRPWFGRPVPLHKAGLALGAVVLVMMGFLLYGRGRIDTIDQQIARAPHVTVGIIQGNVPQDIKWDKAFAKQTLSRYLGLSQALSPRPDLIVWPETAVPFYFPYDAEFSLELVRGIKTIGTDFIIGSPSVTVLEPDKTLQYHNSVFLISGKGEIVDRYDKSHLVPFGEYVPLRRWLPFLGTIVAQVGDFAAGQPGHVLPWRGHKVGPLICFEMIFPHMSRAQVRNGAKVLVNVTNDAWYGRSSAPHQHFSMAVLRAVENRRALVRSANTGISGFIDPVGRIGKTSDLFVEATLSQPVALLSGSTPYVRWGDFFAWACLVVAVVAGVSVGVMRKTPA